MKKVFLFILTIIIFSSCQDKDFYVIKGFTQGTTYKIIYQGAQNDLGAEVDSVLHDFDMSLSTYAPTSIISRINNDEKDVILDKYFIDMFVEADRIYKKTDGAFDITIAPIVNAYGFGFTDKSARIDSTLIDSLLQYVGMNKVKVTDDNKIQKMQGLMLDGNAIAQGQSVDVICKFLESKGIYNYLVDIGGELKVKGKKYDNLWVIGVDEPIEGNMTAGENVQVKLYVTDIAVATSGNYRKFYVEDGIKYSHSINPKTGFPAKQNILSVTIFAKNAITADALATSCMIMGLEKSKIMIENSPDLEAYFIYVDKNGKTKVYYTKGVEKYLENNLD